VIHIDLQFADDCKPGRYITQMKTNKADKEFVRTAAELAGMTMATFMRTCVFQAACALHSEHNTSRLEPQRIPSETWDVPR